MLQTAVVALLVAACFVYAAWTLMPRAARKALAAALLDRPLPSVAAAFLRRHANSSGGCACDGCDQGTTKAAPEANERTITFHPRRSG